MTFLFRKFVRKPKRGVRFYGDLLKMQSNMNVECTCSPIDRDNSTYMATGDAHHFNFGTCCNCSTEDGKLASGSLFIAPYSNTSAIYQQLENRQKLDDVIAMNRNNDVIVNVHDKPVHLYEAASSSASSSAPVQHGVTGQACQRSKNSQSYLKVNKHVTVCKQNEASMADRGQTAVEYDTQLSGWNDQASLVTTSNTSLVAWSKASLVTWF